MKPEITYQELVDMVSRVYLTGGKPNRIRANAKAIQVITRAVQSPLAQGEQAPVTMLHTPFGSLSIELAEDAPNDMLYIDNKEHAESLMDFDDEA